MTIREFFESKEKLAIHCDTEEKAIALLKAFDKAGYRWKNGEGYTEHTCWVYCKNTCYGNDHCYCNWVAYKSYGYEIIEFEEIELEQPEHIEGKTVEFVNDDVEAYNKIMKDLENLQPTKAKLKIKKGKLGEPAFKKGDGVYILRDMEAMVCSIVVIKDHELTQGSMLDVFDVLEECIRLLSVDGSNTKQQVKEMLERLVDGQ